MGIGVNRNDYHRPNRKENKGRRFRVVRTVAETSGIGQSNVRLVKRTGNLTISQVQAINETENKAFSGVDERDEIPGYLGEVDIGEDAKDPYTSSLHPERFIYYPPFLKKTEVTQRRFGEGANDRWWEWEEEKGLPVPERENRSTHAPWEIDE